MYAYSNDGLSCRAVELDYVAQAGEAVFDEVPTAEQLRMAFPEYNARVLADANATSNEEIKRQLAELDAKAQRATRDAILELAAAGVPLPATTLSRIQDIEAQAVALRAKLV